MQDERPVPAPFSKPRVKRKHRVSRNGQAVNVPSPDLAAKAPTYGRKRYTIQSPVASGPFFLLLPAFGAPIPSAINDIAKPLPHTRSTGKDNGYR